MKRQILPSAFLILGLSITPAAFADADAEREALANFTHELNALEPLIKEQERERVKERGQQGKARKGKGSSIILTLYLICRSLDLI